MANIAGLPVFSPALLEKTAASTRSSYGAVKVNILAWAAEEHGSMGETVYRAKVLSESFGWRVTVTYGDLQPHLAAQPGEFAAHCGLVMAWHDQLKAVDGVRTLLITIYIGHGCKERGRDSADHEPSERLYGAHGNLRIPITYLQECGRDITICVDTLFFLETCFGGFDGLPARSAVSDTTLCETLAAGPGDRIIAGNGPFGFLHRILGALWRNRRDGIAVCRLFDTVYDPTIPFAMGHRRIDGGRFELMVLVSMPNSYAAQALLPPRGLLPLPDDFTAGTFIPPGPLTPAQRQEFIDWPYKVKSLMLRMMRSGCTDPSIWQFMVNLILFDDSRQQSFYPTELPTIESMTTARILLSSVQVPPAWLDMPWIVPNAPSAIVQPSAASAVAASTSRGSRKKRKVNQMA